VKGHTTTKSVCTKEHLVLHVRGQRLENMILSPRCSFSLCRNTINAGFNCNLQENPPSSTIHSNLTKMPEFYLSQ